MPPPGAAGTRRLGSRTATSPRRPAAPWRRSAQHPRHLVLAALVVGLLLPRGRARRSSCRPRSSRRSRAARCPPSLAVAALLGGRDARRRPPRRARRRRRSRTRTAGPSTARAVVLEPVRERAAGPAVARVRLLDGLGAGEQAVMRVRRNAYAGRLWSPSARARGRRGGACRWSAQRGSTAPARGWPEVGDIVVVRGQARAARALRRLPGATQRPRRDRRDARRPDRRAARRRRSARSTASGARPSAGWSAGSAAPEAALLRGMVLGEDERLTRGRPGRLPGVGARAHPRRAAART